MPPEASGRRLLAVFAHPDDETFLAGPLLAKYAHAGADVQLVCATVAAPVNAVAPHLRWIELACAARVLGLGRLHPLGYDDASRAPGGLAAASLDQVSERLLEVLHSFQPQVVVTDSAYGAYGHADHILMHRAAVVAVRRYASEYGKSVRLYALAYPMALVRLEVRIQRLLGVDTHRLGGRDDIDLARIVRGSYPVSARVDVRAYVRFRKEAGRCYESQVRAAPLPLKLLEASPVWVQRRIFGYCHLTRLDPPHTPGLREADLFQGV